MRENRLARPDKEKGKYFFKMRKSSFGFAHFCGFGEALCCEAH